MSDNFDIGSLLGVAQQMQEQMAAAQEAAATTIVEGVSGGGAVKVTMTAAGEFQGVEISADAVDPNDVDMLQDLVLAALRDVMARSAEVQAEAMGPLAGGVGGIDPGQLGLGDLDLGGLLGGGADGPET